MATLSLVKAFKKSIRPVVIGLASMFTANGAIADNPPSVTEPTGKIYASPATQALFGPVIWEGVEKIPNNIDFPHDILVISKNDILPKTGRLTLGEGVENLMALMSLYLSDKFSKEQVIESRRPNNRVIRYVYRSLVRDEPIVARYDVDQDGEYDITLIVAETSPSFLGNGLIVQNQSIIIQENLPSKTSERLWTTLHELGHLASNHNLALKTIIPDGTAEEIIADQFAFHHYKRITGSIPLVHAHEHRPNLDLLDNIVLQRATESLGRNSQKGGIDWYATHFALSNCSWMPDQIEDACHFKSSIPNIDEKEKIDGMFKVGSMVNYLIGFGMAFKVQFKEDLDGKREYDPENYEYVYKNVPNLKRRGREDFQDYTVTAIAALTALDNAGYIQDGTAESLYAQTIMQYVKNYGIDLERAPKYQNSLRLYTAFMYSNWKGRLDPIFKDILETDTFGPMHPLKELRQFTP